MKKFIFIPVGIILVLGFAIFTTADTITAVRSIQEITTMKTQPAVADEPINPVDEAESERIILLVRKEMANSDGSGESPIPDIAGTSGEAAIAFLNGDDAAVADLPREKIRIPSVMNGFYLKALADVSVGDIGSVILFDSLVRRVSAKRDIIHRAMPRDASIENVKPIYDLWRYIRSVSKTVADEDGLVTAASLYYYTKKYSLPLSLAVGVAQMESNFRKTALSNVGAAGPMQVMWKYHYGLLQANGISTRDQLFDPELGVAAGCLILSRYLRAEQSVLGGLRRYYGVLSNNYVGTVYTYRNSYELYISGVAENWRAIHGRERQYWNLMVDGRDRISVPKDIRGPAIEKEILPNSSNRVTVQERPLPRTAGSIPSGSKTAVSGSQPKKDSGTAVYMGGSITIRRADGTVVNWRE